MLLRLRPMLWSYRGGVLLTAKDAAAAHVASQASVVGRSAVQHMWFWSRFTSSMLLNQFCEDQGLAMLGGVLSSEDVLLQAACSCCGPAS